MNRTRPCFLFPAAALFGLALMGGGFSYWAAARTPLQPLSSSLSATMDSLAVLFILCSALVALVAICHLLDAWSAATPVGARPYVRAVCRLPPWVTALPVSLSASYVAARIGLSPNPNANFWPALGLWLGGMALLLFTFLPGQALTLPRLRVPTLTWSRVLASEVAIIALVAAIALALRAAKLDAAPFLINGDEESMGSEALHVVEGDIKNMFSTAWEGVPSINFFIQAGAFKIFGTGIVAIRMVSALAGTAAVVMTYLFLRDMFGRGQAVIGALFMAAYHFHLAFSRAGLVNIWDTPVAAAAMYFAYRASRDERPFDFAALGIVCGLGLYAYSTTRAVSLVVIAYFAYVSILRWSFLRRNLANILLTVTAFGVAAMPLGTYFLAHTDTFAGRLGSVGLFQSGWYDQQVELGESPVSVLWDQVLHALGFFVYYPNASNVNLYDSPHSLIPGLAAVPFIAGFVYSLLHIEKKEYALLLLALAVPTVLGGILTVPPTAWQRYLGAIPAISALVAVGLWQLADRLLAWKRSLVPLTALAAVTFLGAQNIELYFRAAVNDVAFGAMIRAQTAHYVDPLPKDTRVYWFGAPDVWASFVTFSLADRQLIEVFDPAPQDIPPVDAPSPSVYLFMPHREQELPPLRTKCPGGTTRTLSSHGDKVLTVYELFQDNSCVPSLEPSPGNDDFVNSAPVSGLPFADTISTKAATIEPGEPQPGPPKPGDPMPCGGVNNTAWYSFVPAADVPMVAEAVGSSADALVAVYQGADLASLTPVACSSHLPEHRARVEFIAQAGNSYHFQTAALSYAIGTVTFALAAAPTGTTTGPAGSR